MRAFAASLMFDRVIRMCMSMFCVVELKSVNCCGKQDKNSFIIHQGPTKCILWMCLFYNNIIVGVMWSKWFFKLIFKKKKILKYFHRMSGDQVLKTESPLIRLGERDRKSYCRIFLYVLFTLYIHTSISRITMLSIYLLCIK